MAGSPPPPLVAGAARAAAPEPDGTGSAEDEQATSVRDDRAEHQDPPNHGATVVAALGGVRAPQRRTRGGPARGPGASTSLGVGRARAAREQLLEPRHRPARSSTPEHERPPPVDLLAGEGEAEQPLDEHVLRRRLDPSPAHRLGDPPGRADQRGGRRVDGMVDVARRSPTRWRRVGATGPVVRETGPHRAAPRGRRTPAASRAWRRRRRTRGCRASGPGPPGSGRKPATCCETSELSSSRTWGTFSRAWPVSS